MGNGSAGARREPPAAIFQGPGTGLGAGGCFLVILIVIIVGVEGQVGMNRDAKVE